MGHPVYEPPVAYRKLINEEVDRWYSPIILGVRLPQNRIIVTVIYKLRLATFYLVAT